MRKGPPEHAGEFDLGERRIGNDGNMWEIIQTKNGVKRWNRLTQRRSRGVEKGQTNSREQRFQSRRRARLSRRRRSRRRTQRRKKRKTKKVDRNPTHQAHKGKTYSIHDNGGTPFKVVISGKKVSIYEQPNWKDWESETGKEYTKLIKTFSNVKKIFIGKDRKLGKNFDGNSILLQLSKNKYVYIGSWIYEFVTKDDSIVAYFSKVGNSDVPYPVALGEKNVYFMLEATNKPTYGRRKHVVGAAIVPRSVFPPNTDWEDAYMLFYGHHKLDADGHPEPLKKYAKKFYKMKVIKKRHW